MTKSYHTMKKFLFISAVLSVSICTLPSCTKELQEEKIEIAENAAPVVNEDIVTIEEALERLDAFLSEVDMVMTKSGMRRKVASVETYYGVATKAVVTGAEEPVPAAYIVNFEDDNGFAVLGGNRSVPPIIAVTERGNLEEGFLDKQLEPLDYTYDVDGNKIDLTTFDFYSEEYDDYYVMMSNPSNDEIFLQDIFRIGTQCDNLLIDRPFGGSVGGSSTYATVTPMLKTEWNQGKWDQRGVYNRYCYKLKCNGNRKYVSAGCSTTALATIIAYNEYPTDFSVNGHSVDLSLLNDSSSEENYDEEVALLFGSIFQNVSPLFRWEAGTCITPEQIKKCMTKTFNYENVRKISSSSFGSSFCLATSDMLKAGRPVFVSAMKGINGHSWVIDGARYAGSGDEHIASEGTWILHCDWGWGGKYNGYFSSNCFDPDREGTELKPYGWHFRLITYSVPANQNPVNLQIEL